jgi:hypothetical protein
MTLSADIMLAIQVEVRRQLKDAQARDKQWGTVASRTFNTWAEVTFDDSNATIPCKIGDVEAYEGDRVGLLKIGNWWTVVTCMTKYWPSRAGVATVQTTPGTTTNASFNDVPTPADVTFVKRWDTTRVRVEITAGSFPNVTASCEAEWGARFTSSQGVVNTYAIINTPDFAGGERMYSTSFDYLSGLAADTYTVRVMWRRKSGTATVQTDNFETIAIDLEEISP